MCYYIKARIAKLIYAPVAQPVEHLTFNQGVRDSNSRRSTKGTDHSVPYFFTKLVKINEQIKELIFQNIHSV